jgi:integrase
MRSLEEEGKDIVMKKNMLTADSKQDGITALQAYNIAQSVNRAFEIAKEYTSENTRRSHTGDLGYWQAWLSAIGFSFEDRIEEQEVATFIVQHIEGLDQRVDEKLVEQGHKQRVGSHSLATIKRRVASLSIFLELAKRPNPCRSKDIKMLLSKLTKKYGTSKPSGKAITKDILDDMLDTCTDKLIDIRDRALLLFAWASGGRRRSEVSTARLENLTRTNDNDFIYLIARSKTDQSGAGHHVPIKGRAAYALENWLTAANIKEGAIFRAVKKGGHVGKALSDEDIYRIVHARLKKAGYNAHDFCAHSLRSGFVTEAGRRGKPLGDVMALTTHKNVSTVMKYYQAGNILNNSASNLAD